MAATSRRWGPGSALTALTASHASLSTQGTVRVSLFCTEVGPCQSTPLCLPKGPFAPAAGGCQPVGRPVPRLPGKHTGDSGLPPQRATPWPPHLPAYTGHKALPSTSSETQQRRQPAPTEFLPGNPPISHLCSAASVPTNIPGGPSPPQHAPLILPPKEKYTVCLLSGR